jgi:hypothetical protein
VDRQGARWTARIDAEENHGGFALHHVMVWIVSCADACVAHAPRGTWCALIVLGYFPGQASGGLTKARS